MNAQNLYFNILTFDFPEENQTFYFTNDDNGKGHKIHKTLFPNEIDCVFSGVNIKVRQQNLPVTIKYPEMIAKIAPHFDDDDIPEFGKDNLWFL